MIKIFIQIMYFIRNFLRMFFEWIIGLIVIRDKRIVLAGQRTPVTQFNKVSKDYFMHNTKYLFLKFGKNSEFKFVYLCDDLYMSQKLKSLGYMNIYKRNSFKGIYYALRAKYWLYNNWKEDVTYPILSSGAICINVWHGIPLKKIGTDMQAGLCKLREKGSILYRIYKFLRAKSTFLVVNGEYEQSAYETAFLNKKEDIKILGSPRLDVLYNEIPYSDLFMEKDASTIKHFKEQGKKIFFYAPTFRDTGKDIAGWLKSDKLKSFLKNNNAVLICKLHFSDKNSLNFELTDEFYKMGSDTDIYPVLKYSDALITDYSSIYFDYLLLDKPILYYPVDLEEYQAKCRGFYAPYEDLTAGIKAYNEDELINAMQDVINGIDNYKEQRKRLQDRMFKFQDGKNCERFTEWMLNQKDINE